MSTNRYTTELKYKNGNGVVRNAKLYFELAPIELADWTIANPFEANELRAGLSEMDAVRQEDSRDLTQDEIYVMLDIIRILAEISAGRPTDDGEYFIKDKNWTSSYAYREFRTFLFTHPTEMNDFMTVLLNAEVMAEFEKALAKANDEVENAPAETKPAGHERSIEDLQAELARRTAANAERQASIGSQA